MLSADRKPNFIWIVINCALSGPCRLFPSNQMRMVPCTGECLHKVNQKWSLIQTMVPTAINMKHLPALKTFMMECPPAYEHECCCLTPKPVCFVRSLYLSILFRSSSFAVFLSVYMFHCSITSETPLWPPSQPGGKSPAAHINKPANRCFTQAWIVQQEQKKAARRTCMHIRTAHFCSPLPTDTRILQPDTGDGLDALSRQRGSMFSPAAPRNLENGDTHTHTHRKLNSLHPFHLKKYNSSLLHFKPSFPDRYVSR